LRRPAAAVAATVAESWETGEPEFYSVAIDRPFLFFVYDEPTGFVLYSGRFSG
jgi:serine protease inhibitor